jgi:hypothetical protein
MYEWKREAERTCVESFGFSAEEAQNWIGNVTMYDQIGQHKRELLEKEDEKFKELLKNIKISLPSTSLEDKEWIELAHFCRKYGRNQFEKGKIEGTDYSDCSIFRDH